MFLDHRLIFHWLCQQFCKFDSFLYISAFIQTFETLNGFLCGDVPLRNYSWGDHSPGKPGKVWEFQSGQGKVREKSGEVKSGVFFQALNTPKLVFRPRTLLGELTVLPQAYCRLGRGTPHPLPPPVTTPTVK